ncbi:MAG: serine/threonine-protein kinase, partial [Vicinamibacterales bacterium]
LPSGTRACPCGGPVAAALVPAVLSGKFAVEARIGAGGVGIVYRARDLGLGRLVAIKTLPIVTRPEETWRLRREARAMALVSHAHLAMIYGLESWRGQPLLVVEYLAGGTLADRLRRGPLPLDDVIALGGTLATALGALHGERLLHRDLKPSNVGYTAGRVVKVLDFGLASLVAPEADSQSTTRSADPLAQHTGRGAGTPAYMAPEALRGDAPSAAFDLWSLAVLLVEGLIGRNPFHGESLIETVARVERHRSSDVVGWLSGQAPRVVEFFAAALDPAAATRPQCATEFAAALSRCGRLAS